MQKEDKIWSFASFVRRETTFTIKEKLSKARSQGARSQGNGLLAKPRNITYLIRLWRFYPTSKKTSLMICARISLVNVTSVVTLFSALEVTRQALRNVGIDNQLQCEIFKVNQTSSFSFSIRCSSLLSFRQAFIFHLASLSQLFLILKLVTHEGTSPYN